VSLSTLQSKAAKRRDDAQRERLIKTPNKNSPASHNSKSNGFAVINDSRAKLERGNCMGEQMEMEVMQVDVVKSRQSKVSIRRLDSLDLFQ